MTDTTDLQLEDYISLDGSRPTSTASTFSSDDLHLEPNPSQPSVTNCTASCNGSTNSTVDDTSKEAASHLITIQSYTRIFITTTEKSASPNPSPKNMKTPRPSSRSGPRVNNTRTTVLSYPKNETETRNEWSYGIACSPMWKCFCGVSDEYRWFSLRGKGICLLVPMLLAYVIVSIAAIPIIMLAAAISSIFLCTGLIMYLARATTKVGVASDDDADDISCWGATWI